MSNDTIKAVLCDIEGTTTSLSFVKDTLFPYAREHLPEFVAKNLDHGTVIKVLDEVRELMQQPQATWEQVAEQLIRWIDEDRKITPLKTLQGLIWEDGYSSQAYFGHLYEDAYRNLKHWHESGIKLYVFSSGSIYAQKLLFGNTQFGDLTNLFSDYFDTTTGPKMEEQSYETIAQEIGLAARHILFLSDIEAELDAARQAGMQTICLVRDKDPETGAPHLQVSDFDGISIESYRP